MRAWPIPAAPSACRGRRPRRPPLAQPASSAPRASDGLRAARRGSHRHVRGTTRTPHHSRLPRVRACPELMVGAPGRKLPHGHADDLRGTSGGPRRPTLGLPAGLLRGRGATGGAGGGEPRHHLPRALLRRLRRDRPLETTARRRRFGTRSIRSRRAGMPGRRRRGHPGALPAILDGDDVSLPDMTG